MTDTDWAVILARKHRRILTTAFDTEAPRPSQETIMGKKIKTVPKPSKPLLPGVPSNPKK